MTMREHMLDKCPVSDYDEVRAIIQEDLGAPPEQLFKQFSETPIASASLAQVCGCVCFEGAGGRRWASHSTHSAACTHSVRVFSTECGSVVPLVSLSSWEDLHRHRPAARY